MLVAMQTDQLALLVAFLGSKLKERQTFLSPGLRPGLGYLLTSSAWPVGSCSSANCGLNEYALRTL